MASKKIYTPPVLHKKDETKDWLCETQIWQCVINMEVKKQGPVGYLSLTDKIQNSCNEISVAN